ncbi:hypothetical protein [Pararhizobium sp. A13]|uniref:hypothetical protein n=1 Tax=Pararhizobium sp. A13 TaxID=3133975 RepID=UPI00324D4CE5
MQKKLLVSVAIIISIISATTTSAQWAWETEKEEKELESETKRLMEELKIDKGKALKEIIRRQSEVLRKDEEARKAVLAEMERLGEQAREKEMGLFAWKRDGLAWAGRPSEKVEAERAAMAAFDCMFLAVRGGADHAGDAERLFAYARERAKRALPYKDNPHSFTPYKHPGTISDDFWIGTLFSDARARIDRLFDDDDDSSLRHWGSSKAADEFDRRNCRFMGKP